MQNPRSEDTEPDGARGGRTPENAVHERAKQIMSAGEQAMRAGKPRPAAEAFAKVLALVPDHSEAAFNLAAIQVNTGRTEQGRALLTDFLSQYPVMNQVPGPNADAPHVLKVRGFDRTQVTVAKSSVGWKTKLRGGHFTTRFLTMDPDFSVSTFTIAGQNLRDDTLVPPYDLLLNTIAEPDVEGRSLESLSRYLARHPETAVINRPERVFETARDRNYQRLQGLKGVRFPRTLRLNTAYRRRDEVPAEIAKLGFQPPFIIRVAGTQTARSTELIHAPADLEQYLEALHGAEFFLIDYHPIYWKGTLFRKLRLFHIDGAFYPVVCHLDHYWNVRGDNRKELMRVDEELMGEERRFLADWKSYVGAANVDCLERVADLLGLEFIGIDFTVDAEGQLFIYEVNPAMRHSFDHAKNFPYKMPYDLATSKAFQDMVSKYAHAARARGAGA